MDRTYFLKKIQNYFSFSPVVALLGPRQVGKTTLANLYRQGFDGPVQLFDLENPLDLTKLENPTLAFENFKEGLIIIDEIQRRPDLFPVLRYMVDYYKSLKFLILGSASRDLIQQSSETLAGRISYLELPPFQFFEVGNMEKLWQRGGFPPSYLADDIDQSWNWRRFYIQTFLERDIPNLGFSIPAQQIGRFWMMLAHYHGNLFNASEIGKSLSISGVTAKKYLDILEGTYMIRQLQPWHENISKRQVKTPKIYFRDSGIFHSIIDLKTLDTLRGSPKLGASFEGFAIEQIINGLNLDQNQFYFWATHQEAELDLFVLKEGKRIGFEFKYGDQPKITKSMRMSIDALKLDELNIIIPADTHFSMEKNIHVWGIKSYINSLNLSMKI